MHKICIYIYIHIKNHNFFYAYIVYLYICIKKIIVFNRKAIKNLFLKLSVYLKIEKLL